MAVGTQAPPPYHFSLPTPGTNGVVVSNSGATLTVDLPSLSSLEGVELDVSSTEVRIRLPGKQKASTISLPFAIAMTDNVSKVSAKFSKRRGQLVLVWPAELFSQAATPSAMSIEPVASVCPDTPTLGKQGHESTPTLFIEGAGETCASSAAPPAPASSPPAPAPPVPAYGSLWNAKSWHWEEKKRLDFAREQVRRSLKKTQIEKLQHIRSMAGNSVALKDIDVQGEATITLRRGKRILYYELDVSFKWEGLDEFGAPLGVKGTCEAKGVTQEDDEAPAVEVQVSAHSSGGTDARDLGQWMRRSGALLVGDALKGEQLASGILAMEEAQADPDMDRARRIEEEVRAKAARAATGATQARIAAEERAAAEAAVDAACARNANAASDGNNGEAVVGSVWNTNAWHWEEKSMTGWSNAWLVREFGDISVPLIGGVARASLTDVKVSGDASVSVRKGKPIVLFQLQIDCSWRAGALDASGADPAGLGGEARGTISVPEFTSEEEARRVQVDVYTSRDPSRGRLTNAFRKDGVAAIRKLLDAYIAALKEQLSRAPVAAT